MTLILLGHLKAVSGRGMFVSFIDLRKHTAELIEGSCGGVNLKGM